MDDRIGTKDASGTVTAYPKTTISGDSYKMPPAIMVDLTPTTFYVGDVFPNHLFDYATAMRDLGVKPAPPPVVAPVSDVVIDAKDAAAETAGAKKGK